jgi:hypothetical protein
MLSACLDSGISIELCRDDGAQATRFSQSLRLMPFPLVTDGAGVARPRPQGGRR